MTKFLNISTDTTLGGNAPSDELAVSQKAIKTYVDNNSGGGSVAIDNTTITKNASDEIQAVATVNANTAAGATNPIYDWVGTLSEYTTQDIENQHPDWVCYITDDFAAQTYEAYTKTQANQLLDNKVGYCSFNTDTRVQITTTDQTAAKNGWLIGNINFSGSNKNVTIFVNSIDVVIGGWSTGSQWFSASICLPIKAGQTYRFSCNGTVEYNKMYFYPDD